LFGRAIVRNLSKFVLGKGPLVKPKSENKLVSEYWSKFLKDNRWSLREKELVRRAFRDGEVFLRRFVDKKTGETKVRFIRANMIRNPSNSRDYNVGENVSYGIGTNPDDIEEVLTYYYCKIDGTLIDKIPAGDIIHIKILTDSDMKRGLSIYYHAMPMIKKYADWLEDRIVLNKVRSAIALIRKVEGTRSAVESIRNAYRSEYQDKDKNKQKVMQRGTVLTASKGIEYEMLSPNIHAQDVKDDGRAMLLAVAAGVGFPEMMLTADYSNANYSSSMVAQNPFVREIEDWQDFFGYYYKLLFQLVIQAHKEYGDKRIPDGESEECTIEWPPLILADTLKNNQARAIQFKHKILSRKTWQLKEGLDPEQEERNLVDEDSKDIYKVPFQLPITPTNQYGGLTEEFFDEE
jgi:capsid protein